MIDCRVLRVVIAVTSILMVVGCTELNPNSCAQNPSLCKPGTYCAHRKDQNGDSVTECLAVEDGAAEPEDAAAIDVGPEYLPAVARPDESGRP